jgi:hypothetical protein
MNCRFLILTIGLCTMLAHGQQATPTPRPTPTPPMFKPAASLRGKLNYKPIGEGVPAGRVDAGSRGDGDEVASLYVLAPEDVGLTAYSQPSLYWFQTAPARLPLEISILKPNDPTPALRLRRSTATASGFQHIDLADHGVSLAAGIDYQWVVALVRDPESRSRDIVSSGWIKHVTRKRAGSSDAAAYAADGFWYDAVTALFAQIAANPHDSQLQADRRDLFTQVGLPPLPTTSKRP